MIWPLCAAANVCAWKTNYEPTHGEGIVLCTRNGIELDGDVE